MAVREKTWRPDGAADGTVNATSTVNWTGVRIAISGTPVTKGNIILRNGKVTGKGGSTWKINRGFVPFDLSNEPKGVKGISNLSLIVLTQDKTEDTGSNYRWVQVIGDTTQQLPTELNPSDFNKCGAVDNPTTWSAQKDFSLFTVQQETTIALNATAITAFEAAMGVGYFLLGLRLGNDIADVEPNDPATENLLSFEDRPVLRLTGFVYPQVI